MKLSFIVNFPFSLSSTQLPHFALIYEGVANLSKLKPTSAILDSMLIIFIFDFKTKSMSLTNCYLGSSFRKHSFGTYKLHTDRGMIKLYRRKSELAEHEIYFEVPFIYIYKKIWNDLFVDKSLSRVENLEKLVPRKKRI